MKRVAVLGSGAMGSRIVQKLNSHYQVVVYNRTANKVKPLLNQGAVYAPTPREAAEQAEIVISMVTDNTASQAVWLSPEIGAAWGLSKTAIAIESSTLTVDWTKELAAEIERRGAAFLDAPVIGSLRQADEGKLIYLVGGKAETFSQAQDILLKAGATIHHVGSIGQGMTMKLAVNALFGVQVAAMAEIMGMVAKSGITSEKAWKCLEELPVISPAVRGAGNLMLANNHAPMFPINLVEKDFRYIIQTAQAIGAVIPASTAAQVTYQNAIAQGYGNDNITGVVQLFR